MSSLEPSLGAPHLDDRRFQDIVDEAKRLIPNFCPDWTNHNVADPGVALIELFAWMTEMSLYRLNQVPERYFTKFLELVGIRRFPPSVARVDLTFSTSAPVKAPLHVPAGTQVSTASGRDREVRFTTVEHLEISPPEIVAALVSEAMSPERFVDVLEDLRFDNQNVTCFGSAPLVTGSAFYIGFADTLAGCTLRLDIGAELEGIGVDPRRPPLSWQVWVDDVWVPTTVRSDGTGGLNRDGALELIIPRRHTPLTLGTHRAHWLRAVLVDPLPGQPMYRRSPIVRSVAAGVVGGTVTAEHSERVHSELLGRSSALPGQRFLLGHSPVLDLEGDERLEVVASDGAVAWTEVDDFQRSGPADRHFVLHQAEGIVEFGPSIRYPDGSVRQHGAIPADGAAIRITDYRTGGGSVGNVGGGTLQVLRTSVAGVTNVTNLRPAAGGVDVESVENARKRGPMTLRTGDRAVTAGDYERLAHQATSEVARARALAPEVTGGPVRLLIVPSLRAGGTQRELDDFALTDELADRLREHLDVRRVLGTVLEIGTPYYQGVSVAARLDVVPGAIPAVVQDRALQRLNQTIDPLTGGPDGDGWPFDVDVNSVYLTELLGAVEGVARVDEVLLFEYDLRTKIRHGEAKQVIRLDSQSLFLSAGHQVVVR